MNNQRVPAPPRSFTVSKNEMDELTPDELIAKANEMATRAREMTAQAQQAAAEKLERDRSLDMETLANLRKEVSKLEFVEKGTHDAEQRAELYLKISKYKADIEEIEYKYNLKEPAESAAPVALEEPSASSESC